MATYYENHENSDDYFDDEPRRAKDIWKRFTMDQLKAFVASKKGKLYSSVELEGMEFQKIREGILLKSGGFNYRIELK